MGVAAKYRCHRVSPPWGGAARRAGANVENHVREPSRIRFTPPIGRWPVSIGASVAGQAVRPVSSVAVLVLMLIVLVVPSTGCTSSTRPGDLSAVRVVGDREHTGNVYLLRGWIGIFSAGIDQLGQKIDHAGVRATVYQEAQWRALAERIADTYAAVPASKREPLVLIGHSYGADGVLRIARRLQERGVEVDLLVTLDPVTPPKVPANVKLTYNLFQSNPLTDPLPFLRGIPLTPDDGNTRPVINADLRKDRLDLLAPGLDHFNIEKQPQVHADVLARVLKACPPRKR